MLPCCFTSSMEEESIVSVFWIIRSVSLLCLRQSFRPLGTFTVEKNKKTLFSSSKCVYLWPFIWNSCVALCRNFNGCTEKVKVLILVFIILCPKNNGCFLTHPQTVISVSENAEICTSMCSAARHPERKRGRQVKEIRFLPKKKGFYFPPFLKTDVRHEDMSCFKEQWCEYCLTGERIRLSGTKNHPATI